MKYDENGLLTGAVRVYSDDEVSSILSQKQRALLAVNPYWFDRFATAGGMPPAVNDFDLTNEGSTHGRIRRKRWRR